MMMSLRRWRNRKSRNPKENSRLRRRNLSNPKNHTLTRRS